jgi:quercetin 2,3-dioxygenase
MAAACHPPAAAASRFITSGYELETQVALAGSPHSWNARGVMKTTLRKATDRGHANHGWLDSRHTFSFADYHDPAQMGYRSLRAINDDKVAPGGGFPTHPHRDMEIFSYVVSGAIEHKDSMGNGRRLLPGQIQLMSAGSGVTHSEFNPLRDEPLHLLQIWIKPHTHGLRPSYTEWHPTPESEAASKVLVISADGRENSATIHQDASIYRLRLRAGESVDHELAPGRGLWLQLIRGKAVAAGASLSPGDGLSAESPGTFTVTATEDAEALLFDLA